MTDSWALVHAERAALAEDMARVGPAAWEVPSLCAGWTVHDVVAHLSDGARTTRSRFFLDMFRARFDFDRQNEYGVVRGRGASPSQTLAGLRSARTCRRKPPGPLDTRLVEEVVHGEDVRRPLGIVRDYPTPAVLLALQQQLRTRAAFGGAREQLAHLSLRATDTELSAGTGPEVTGPALELLLAVTGRAHAAKGLEGPGVDRLG